MKKKKVANLIIFFLSVALFLVCWLLVHSLLSNHKPDDAISKALFDKMGRKKLEYKGRTVISNGGDVFYKYEYIIDSNASDELGQILQVVNETIEQENMKEKIYISFWTEYTHGTWSFAFSLMNYSDESKRKPDFLGMQHLRIGYDDQYGGPFCDPDTYKNLNGITFLEISHEKWQKYAEEKGVDWFEYLPDLERLDVEGKTIYISTETN